METFDLILDELVAVWERKYVSVEAESLEEALEKVDKGDYELNDSETLYDTEEYLSPSKEFPTTMEIFLSDDESNPILSNRKVIDHD